MASDAAQRAQGRWLRGTSGNPQGRPPGRPNKSTAYLQELLAGKAEQVIRTVVNAAIAGDLRACKLVIERLIPKRVGQPMEEGVAREIASATDAPAALACIATAALDGRISTTEAAELASVVEGYRRAVHTADLVARLESLEQRAEQRDAGRDGQRYAHP